MERVAIIGPGGAGKSTLARRLGKLTGLPVVHLDTEYWRPGWVPTPEDEWPARVAELANRDRWIIDGNYGGTMEPRLDRADTVIYLDFERHTYIWRVLKRRYQHGDRGRSRPDMAEGCEEKIDWAFLKWLWHYPPTRRPEALGLMANAHRLGKRVVILRDDRQVRAFLDGVARGVAPRPVRLDRVNLVGGAAAGKTALAKPLSDRTGLPIVHLGDSFDVGGTFEVSLREQHCIVLSAIAKPAWIMDGAYWRTLSVRLAASDLTIFTDTATDLRIRRYMHRLRHHHRSGRPIRWRKETIGLLWAIAFPAAERRRILPTLGSIASSQPLFVVRTPKEAAAVLAGLAPVALEHQADERPPAAE